MIKFSTFAFWLLAFSTRSRILATVDSPYSFVVRIFKIFVRLIQPLMISSPTDTFLGTASPVRAFVSSMLLPSNTIPSRGIRSPGFTMIVSPTATSSGNTSSSTPSRRTTALSGLISIKDATDFLD